MRCVHEASLHDANCFITLTYREDDVPEDNSLDVRHWQLFMKKVRKKYGEGIRFFHCGEYGDDFDRPHYHALLFNHDWEDKKLWKNDENPLYTSQVLEDLWGLGYCTSAAVTFESAAYVARYSLKKITGEKAKAHYRWVCPETGEVFQRRPEYSTQSKRPGIGREWWVRYGREVLGRDEVVLCGKVMQPPRYYDKVIASSMPDLAQKMKGARVREARRHRADSTSGRLRVREKVRESRVALLASKKLERS